MRPVWLRDDGGDEEGAVHYHCTGFRGRCGNTYIREEALSKLFEDIVRRVQIPAEVAEGMAQALRDSQDDKERFHLTAVMRLQQQYLAVQQKLDRAYEDRLSGKVSEELWTRKSAEWEADCKPLAARRGSTSGPATTTP